MPPSINASGLSLGLARAGLGFKDFAGEGVVAFGTIGATNRLGPGLIPSPKHFRV